MLGLSYNRIHNILKLQGHYSSGISVQLLAERVLAAIFIFIFLIDEYAIIDKTMITDVMITHDASDHAVNFRILYKGKSQNVKLLKKELVIVYKWLLQMKREHSNLIRDLELGKSVEDLIHPVTIHIQFQLQYTSRSSYNTYPDSVTKRIQIQLQNTSRFRYKTHPDSITKHIQIQLQNASRFSYKTHLDLGTKHIQIQLQFTSRSSNNKHPDLVTKHI
ncbi:unnamed protein product [Mytilus coruscus]|uniref:Uncharacterized protein n=1 Tax=Mytilus coruscus TaxID=42192 RepID=A0A6J8CV03_MYTCO|nr:unnamed protein product [Mytilus coruscus]